VGGVQPVYEFLNLRLDGLALGIWFALVMLVTIFVWYAWLTK